MSNSKNQPEDSPELSGVPSVEKPPVPDENSAGTGQGGKPKAPEQGKRKMGLVTFIQLSEPKVNKYIQAILKNKRSMESHTKDEWEQIVKNLLEKKIS